MKPKLMNASLFFGLFALVLFSCKKEDLLSIPQKPGSNKPSPLPGQTPNKPLPSTPAVLKIGVKASIKVGDLDYDSIPATLTLKLWDSTGSFQEKQVQLQPGTNQLELPANTAKVYLKMQQWAVQEEKTIERPELDTTKTIVLHAAKKARKLKEEAVFYLAQGTYYPERRTEYEYNEDGSLFNVRFHRKDVDKAELQWHMNARFYYTGGRLTEIKNYEFAPNAQPIITRIGYDAKGKIETMYHNSYGVITNARFDISSEGISAYHTYNNGHSLTYHMTLVGRNKVREEATTSRGGGEGGTFQYDRNINPYAHMNYPDLFLSKLSKNNITGQQKGFAGAIPSLVPYKWEYTYDAEGYPVQLLKHFKTGGSGEHFITRKIVYTYID